MSRKQVDKLVISKIKKAVPGIKTDQARKILQSLNLRQVKESFPKLRKGRGGLICWQGSTDPTR